MIMIIVIVVMMMMVLDIIMVMVMILEFIECMVNICGDLSRCCGGRRCDGNHIVMDLMNLYWICVDIFTLRAATTVRARGERS